MDNDWTAFLLNCLPTHGAYESDEALWHFRQVRLNQVLEVHQLTSSGTLGDVKLPDNPFRWLDFSFDLDLYVTVGNRLRVYRPVLSALFLNTTCSSNLKTATDKSFNQ